ncbi:MAG TPA: VWA domain-containing protein [Vicinamibacterales bacterium]
MRTILAAIALLLCAVGSPAAQDPPQEPAPDPSQPIFRAATELIAIDATVVDDNGEPIPDLTAADFELLVDGEPRTVVSAEFIRQVPRERRIQEAPARELPFSSNENLIGGRLVLIVFDLEGIGSGAGREASHAATQFLEELSDADQVGVIAFPNGVHIDFTHDREQVRAALQQIVGRGDLRQRGEYNIGISEALEIDDGDDGAFSRVFVRECSDERDELGRELCRAGILSQARMDAVTYRQRADNSLRVLRNLLRAFRQVDAPKTVVWISEGLALPDQAHEIPEIAHLAATARTTLYALHLDQTIIGDASRLRNSPSMMQDRNLMRDGLANIAGATRGTLFTSVGSGSNVFARIAREMAAYYLLSAEPAPSDRDGKSHRIQVRVRRPKVSVRARSEFTMDRSPRESLTPEQRLALLIRQPIFATELPLKVTTYSLRTPQSSDVRLVITTELGRGATAPEQVGLGYVLLDERGKIVADSFEQYNARPLHDNEPSPLGVSTTVQVPPGRYRLRLAALDGTGRGGSVEHRLDASLASTGDLGVADLMLTPATGEGLSSVQLVADAAISRELFAAYLELYPENGDAVRAARVRIEVAESETGPAISSVDAQVLETKEPGRLVAQSLLPVGLLPPGEYWARAVVSSGGRPAIQSRPFRLIQTIPAGHEFKRDLASRVGQFSPDQVLQPELLAPALERAKALDADAPDAARAAADAVAEGRLESLDRGTPESRSSVLATFLRGLALYKAGDLEAAAQQMRAAVRLSPDFMPGVFYLGACYAAGGRGREAVGAWQTSLAGDDSSPEIFQLLVDGYLRIGDTDAAIDIVEEAARKWPDDYRFVIRSTLARAAAGDLRDAFERLRPWLDRPGVDADALDLALRLALADLASRPPGNRADAVANLRSLTLRFEDARRPVPLLAQRWLTYLSGRERP